MPRDPSIIVEGRIRLIVRRGSDDIVTAQIIVLYHYNVRGGLLAFHLAVLLVHLAERD